MNVIEWINPLDINIWTMFRLLIYYICFLLATTQSILMWNLAHTNGHKRDEIKLHLKTTTCSTIVHCGNNLFICQGTNEIRNSLCKYQSSSPSCLLVNLRTKTITWNIRGYYKKLYVHLIKNFCAVWY